MNRITRETEDIPDIVKLLIILALVAFVLSGCCPYAFKCGVADSAVTAAACPEPTPPKGRTFGDTTNALADTVKQYRECRAACVR